MRKGIGLKIGLTLIPLLLGSFIILQFFIVVSLKNPLKSKVKIISIYLATRCFKNGTCCDELEIELLLKSL